ncbi:hypothetical protein UA70_18000 [Raoultella planticola]|nr:hypothetical protein UA70_18000 [Raoultella planticola]
MLIHAESDILNMLLGAREEEWPNRHIQLALRIMADRFAYGSFIRASGSEKTLAFLIHQKQKDGWRAKKLSMFRNQNGYFQLCQPVS